MSTVLDFQAKAGLAMPTQGSVRVIRFGDYALDLASGELRKHGHKLPLPDQAIRILILLLERPGEVVAREQLIAQLWPNGTVVDFDHGINSSVRRLRAALNDSAEQPRYIETLPRRGYRFIAPVQSEDQEVRTESQTEISFVQGQSSGPPTGWKWAWLGISLVGLSVLLGFGVLRWRTAPAQSIRSIAVLPLVNATHDSNADYLSDGISEEVINTLSAVPHLKVIARTSAFQFKGKAVDPRKVGRELGVGAVLTGTLTQHGDALVIQADLVDVADGSELWGERYRRRMADLQSLQGDMAREIASTLRLKLGDEAAKRLTKRYTENSEAYAWYLKAARAENPLDRLRYLQRSIAKDPHFALAYVRLALTDELVAKWGYGNPTKAYTEAKAAAMKALELDDHLGEAHVALAEALLNLTWDWAGCERELTRAMEANANVAHLAYSWYLMRVGRTQEALVEAQRAEQIDPLSPDLHAALALLYYGAHEYDRSIEEAQTPGVPAYAQKFRAFALAEKGDYAESIALLKANASDAGDQGHLGYAYAKAGQRAGAQRICRELQHRAEQEGVGAYEAAFLHAALGQKEEAFHWLDLAYQQHDPGMTYLKRDPCLDSLRSDPRFPQLVRRVGLVP
ncbi:MAG: winged helix-turn-helix domain-containing protein [Acidobacteriaceae bacterium]|nr:winged helix-turn-helix domain-containing protein [Acidobacteriaceae bacterium]